MIDWKRFVGFLLVFTGCGVFLAGVVVAAATENPLWLLLWIYPTIVFSLAFAMEE